MIRRGLDPGLYIDPDEPTPVHVDGSKFGHLTQESHARAKRNKRGTQFAFGTHQV